LNFSAAEKLEILRNLQDEENPGKFLNKTAENF